MQSDWSCSFSFVFVFVLVLLTDGRFDAATAAASDDVDASDRFPSCFLLP